MDFTFYESVMNRVQFLDGVHEDKKARRTDTVGQIESLKKEKDILDKTEKVLKHLTDKLVKNDLTKMDNLVTYGLKTVYANRNFQFKSEVQERGRKMWIDLQTINDGNLTDPQAKSSVHVVESFLLRVLCILKTKRARLLLMDETFAAVDSEYVENLYQLVSELCKKLNMDVLLVTHFPGCTEIVDHSYKLTGSENKAEVVQVK
jgi:ABC-type transport system involved in cytochrome c biogenesis ATPase subunit